MVKKFITIF